MRRLIPTLAAACLLTAARPVTQSTPSAESPRRATLDAVVTDRAGAFIPGLTAADFRVVAADGKPVAVAAIREVHVPANGRGRATPAAEAPLDAANQHTPDARLFVVLTEPMQFEPAIRNAREFLADLSASLRDDDAIAVVVAGRPARWLPPTSDAAVVARAIAAFPTARVDFDARELTYFTRDQLPKLYQSLMQTTWARRAIIWLTPGIAGPDAFQDYKSWNAWAQRANAPMHAVDPLGNIAGGSPRMGLMDQPLLRQAANETGGLLFVNRPSMTGIAENIVETTRHFYEIQIEVPAGVKTDQSFYTTVKTHPTSKTHARLRVRIAEPSELSAHKTNELRNALSAILPMDEIPLALSVESTIGATAATVRFLHQDARRSTIVELPAGPLTLAFGALTDTGKLQDLGTREITPETLTIEGCCPAVRQDIVIPKNAISLRVAVYQHPTGKVGAVYLAVDGRKVPR